MKENIKEFVNELDALSKKFGVEDPILKSIIKYTVNKHYDYFDLEKRMEDIIFQKTDELTDGKYFNPIVMNKVIKHPLVIDYFQKTISQGINLSELYKLAYHVYLANQMCTDNFIRTFLAFSLKDYFDNYVDEEEFFEYDTEKMLNYIETSKDIRKYSLNEILEFCILPQEKDEECEYKKGYNDSEFLNYLFSEEGKNDLHDLMIKMKEKQMFKGV